MKYTVKSSNSMLNDEYNAKLRDFGLGCLVDHKKHAATTLEAGPYGYIAPEDAGGKYTEKTDVFSFGVVALEIASSRNPVDVRAENQDDIRSVDFE